jgi:hypothetical protein
MVIKSADTKTARITMTCSIRFECFANITVSKQTLRYFILKNQLTSIVYSCQLRPSHSPASCSCIQNRTPSFVYWFVRRLTPLVVRHRWDLWACTVEWIRHSIRVPKHLWKTSKNQLTLNSSGVLLVGIISVFVMDQSIIARSVWKTATLMHVCTWLSTIFLQIMKM